MEIGGLTSALAPAILQSRISAFNATESGPYLPLLPTDFEMLYEVLSRNLRAVLSHADEFCVWVSDHSPDPTTNESKHQVFETWFQEQCRKVHDAADGSLTPRRWEIFDRAVELGGVFAPNDYPKFGCKSMPALRPILEALEEAQLVKSSRDDRDKRRKSIVVTPRGRLAAEYRRTLKKKSAKR